MKYVELQNLIGQLPMVFIVQALDDAQDVSTFGVDALAAAMTAKVQHGTTPPNQRLAAAVDRILAIWATVQDDVGKEIDGALSERFPVPFVPPLPAAVVNTARVLALDTLYGRRGFTDDKTNRFLKQAESERSKLKRIAAAEEQLEPSRRPAKPPITIITDKAKTTLTNGGMLA